MTGQQSNAAKSISIKDRLMASSLAHSIRNTVADMFAHVPKALLGGVAALAVLVAGLAVASFTVSNVIAPQGTSATK